MVSKIAIFKRKIENASTKKKSKKFEAPSKGKSTTKTEKRRVKTKKSYESYKSCIFKVLKSIHGDIGISNKAMEIMNSFIIDMKEKIWQEASQLSRRNNKSTISPRDVEFAVKLVLNGKLAKNAMHQGTLALECFKSY